MLPFIKFAFRDVTSIVLVIVNLFSIFVITSSQGGVFPVIFLFWIETLILGILNIPKIIFYYKWKSIGAVPFFIMHFGIFMTGHLFFSVALFAMGFNYTGPLNDISNIPLKLLEDVKILLPAIVGLGSGQIFSFIYNYIGNKEYIYSTKGKNKSKDNPMVSIYGRVVIMHLVIMFGGFLMVLIGTNIANIFALVMLKVVFDIAARKEESVLASQKVIQ